MHNMHTCNQGVICRGVGGSTQTFVLFDPVLVYISSCMHVFTYSTPHLFGTNSTLTVMEWNVNIRKLLSVYKSHVREISLFTGTIPNQVRNSQTSRFIVGSKPGKVKPKRQRGATVVTGGGGGHVVAQE